MAKLKVPGIGRALSAAIPRSAGGSMFGHVLSRNARKDNLVHMPGVSSRKPKMGGLSHDTAPQKHEMDFFPSAGLTGTTGER